MYVGQELITHQVVQLDDHVNIPSITYGITLGELDGPSCDLCPIAEVWLIISSSLGRDLRTPAVVFIKGMVILVRGDLKTASGLI